MARSRVSLFFVVLLVVACVLAATPASATVKKTSRVSLSASGVQGTTGSVLNSTRSTSSDGRYVTFASADGLVPTDNNAQIDVYVRDRKLGATLLASCSTSGALGDGASYDQTISSDGRFVAFDSTSTNLVPADTNGVRDVFVRDLLLRKTFLVSRNTSGALGNADSLEPSISAHGRYVAFISLADNLAPGDTNAQYDVFVRDRKLHTTTLISKSTVGTLADLGSSYPSISLDGRFVAFESDATDLVPGDTNGFGDVFVRDRKHHTTTRVSVRTDGSQADGASAFPSISGLGRFVAFESDATNLVKGDTNGATDVFVRDRGLRRTVRVSVNSAGIQGNDVSLDPSISADGRVVAFDSIATNLVKGDANGHTDVFVRDFELHTTQLVSRNTLGEEGNDDSDLPAVSGDGRFIAFESLASNLVARDTNAASDVFVRGPFG